MKVRLGAALACAAVLISAGAAPAQTTMAPTAVPVVGPTASATKAPGMTPDATPAPGGAMMTMPMPAGTLAIDARGLTARRTATGFTLGGQAEVKDGCQGARFDFFPGRIFPPQYNLDQFRRPGTMGMMCIQKVMWVPAAPRAVVASKTQRTVTVHTQKRAYAVPIR